MFVYEETVMGFIRGCTTGSWYWREWVDHEPLVVMLIPKPDRYGRITVEFGKPYGADGEDVPEEEVPDEVWAALAKWRLMGDVVGEDDV